MIATIDLGTSATKAMVWGESGPVASGRAVVATRFAPGEVVEQDADDWWASAVGAMADAAARAGAERAAAFAAVDALGLCGARQTFVPVDDGLAPIGPAIVWSDRRATAEVRELAASFGGAEAARQATGMVLDGAAVSAKIAWLARHQPERLSGARWLLSPRDLVLWRLTGSVVTDITMASASGLYDATGAVVPDLAGPAARLLPEAVSPVTAVGMLGVGAAEALGLRAGIPVVVGAGDRACEVIGTGASESRPMVSWGTTANVSVPVRGRPDPVPVGVVVTAGALGGWQIEGGVSAAGSFLAWLARLTRIDVDALMEAAADSPPGARGVTATAWLGGARAPWWSDAARAAMVGLGFDHGPGDLARAAVEAVAYDVARCLESIGRRPGAAGPVALVAGGDVRRSVPWVDVLAAVTGLPVARRGCGEAASCGAAVLAGRGVGIAFDAEVADPVVGETRADPATVASYRELRRKSDRAADAVLALARDVSGDAAGDATGSPAH